MAKGPCLNFGRAYAPPPASTSDKRTGDRGCSIRGKRRERYGLVDHPPANHDPTCIFEHADIVERIALLWRDVAEKPAQFAADKPRFALRRAIAM